MRGRSVWPAGLRTDLLALLCLLLAALPARAQPSQAQPTQVFLIQNSGWMEPFLTAPDSQFRPLVKALAAATRGPGGPVTVAAFNQEGQVPGRTSPQALYAGPYDAQGVAAAIDRIDLPFKKGSRAYADADFNGALIGTIRTLLKGREGVIWMVTNNKNAPGNSAEVQANTQAFYASLRGAEAISRIVAYPVRMPLKGRNFREGGFVVYGIGYGAGGGRALEAILAEAPVRALFSHPPVGLKPALEGGVGLILDGVETGALTATMENGVLVVRGARAAEGATLTLRARLRNGFYPQRIASAALDLRWSEIGAGEAALARAAISPARIENLGAQAESGPYTVTLTIPPIPRKGGLAGLFADDRTVDGTLAITLRDLALDLDPAFLERVRPIFAGSLFAEGQARSIESQMPDIFLDFRRTPQAVSAIPVRVMVAVSPWPLVGAGLGGILLAAAAAAGLGYASRPRSLTVSLGGQPRRVTLRPFRAQILRAPDGGRWRVRAGLFGAARAAALDESKDSAR